MAPSPSSAGASATVQPAAKIEWQTSAARARELSRVGGRWLLVYVRAGWSVPALRMERTVWTDVRVGRAMRTVVGWWVDATAADEAAELEVAELRVKRFPTILLIDRGGVEHGRLEGGSDVDAVLTLLQRAAQ